MSIASEPPDARKTFEPGTGALVGDGVGDLGAPVPDVRVPEAGRCVDVSPAVGVEDAGPFAPVDDELVAVDDAHRGERMPERAHEAMLPTASGAGVSRPWTSLGCR